MVEAFGVSVGGSYLTEEVGSLEVDAVTLGIGASAALAVSLPPTSPTRRWRSRCAWAPTRQLICEKRTP